jgi:hypothetical protein
MKILFFFWGATLNPWNQWEVRSWSEGAFRIFLVGEGDGFFFSKLWFVCRVMVHSSLSTFTVNINFPCKLFFAWIPGGGAKQRVPNNI